MVPITPVTAVGVGLLVTGSYLLVAVVAFPFAGRPREVARDLARLSVLPTLAGLGVAVILALGRPVALLLGLGLGAIAVALPPALAVASAFDDYAVES
ncbi:MAG: hypothetical protein ABEJ05_01910 [Haloglomus sp.]